MARTLIALLLITASAPGQTALPAVLREVRFDQKLNEQVPLDLVFLDEEGRSVRLGDYFGTKPVILVFAQVRCPMLCDQVLNGLVRAMLDMSLELGTDFEVVTVSFDARETPEMAKAKRKSYLERYGRAGAEAHWHFLTGKESAITALTAAVGFRYVHDPVKDQFAHASGIVVLTPEGKVARYFYDVRFSPRDLRLGLVEASKHRISSIADQILLYCFHYDPTLGTYGPTIMSFVRLGGVLTLFGIGGLMFVLWRRDGRPRVVKAE